MTRTLALIPAAGKSVRMGQPKLGLPLGERTVLERVVSAFRQAGIDDILVVLGPHVAGLRAQAENAGALVLPLAEETPDMRATVMHGLAELTKRFQPGPSDAWFLVPADHPTLEPQVIAALLEARAQNPRRSIFLPTFEGRRGHPALIGWQHVAQLESLPVGQGLNAYLRRHAQETCEVPLPFADILADLDTPEDYEAWKLRFT